MSYKDIEKRREYSRKHYIENKEYYKKKKREYRKRTTQFLREIKNNPCADCGKTYPPYVMDFDHVRGDKKFNLCGTMGRYRNKQVLFDEIAKCDVVCANCHRIRTYNRTKPL